MNMNTRLVNALNKRLVLVKNFLDGKTKEYVYHDLASDTKTVITNVEELPCEFYLLMGDKELVNRQKNSLRSELNDFVKMANTSFTYFTGDHLHPVPNSATFDKETYNPTLAYYGLKRNKAFWVKKSGQVRYLYLDHLMVVLAHLDNQMKTLQLERVVLNKTDRGFILSV